MKSVCPLSWSDVCMQPYSFCASFQIYKEVRKEQQYNEA
jgi:hypothetical protein